MDQGFDTERLSSLDEWGNKKIIIPAEVEGRYRRRRTVVHALLMIFFLLLPWLKLNGHQLLLLDIVHREFSIFGLKLYAHDAPFLFPLIAISVFSLVFVTSVWGRVWCGWACPQTVFIDGVFRRIEILVEGKFLQRRRAQTQPMSFSVFRKKCLKWFLFFLVSTTIAHSFVAFFVGSDALLKMMGQNPEQNMTYFVLIFGMTGILLFDFGWFREQFCTIVCPYGRFQSLLLDSTSLAVVYDEKRGEPRRGKPPENGRYGDCISCRRCVEVCPTGIDIRRGVQMECIACTACIDACDDVMAKMKKPVGLIRYSNLDGTTWKLLKPRALMALALVLVFATILFFGLRGRGVVDVNLLRAHGGPLFSSITQPDGTMKFANQFHLHIRNQISSAQTIELKTTFEGVEIKLPENPFIIQPNQDLQIPLFILFPASALNSNGTRQINIQLESSAAKDQPIVINSQLDGPSR
jgi:cytochrome c oxidase accessory protein FixG